MKRAGENVPVPCPNGCGYSCSGINYRIKLKKHMLETCCVYPEFQCMICKKKIRHKSFFKNHMAVVHGQNNF